MSKADAKPRNVLEREWFDLRSLTEYVAVSERTVRDWIHRPSNPLPAAQVGNKLLVKRSDVDRWLASHTVEPAQNVSAIVDDVMRRVAE
jgi:excisionase family DNA binding protein